MCFQRARCGGMEANHHSARRRVYSAGELTHAQRPRQGVTGRARTGAAGLKTPCFRLRQGHHESGDDRTRTGGLSPDKRALCSSELRPRGSAGGIRTHGLELMRLARTTPPLPRTSGWQDSNLRSPAKEAAALAIELLSSRDASPSISETVGDRRSRRAQPGSCGSHLFVGSEPNDVFCATRPPFDPGSTRPGCANAIASSFVEGFWSPALLC